MNDSEVMDEYYANSTQKDEFWTPELEISLAEKIRSFPALYDTSHEDWKNKLHRDDIWELIASELGATVTQCKKKYKGLRDKAVREHRLGKQSNWPAAQAIDFVIPVARIRDNNKSRDTEDDDLNNSNNAFVTIDSSYDVDSNDQEDVVPYNPATTKNSKYPNNNRTPTIIHSKTVSNSEHHATAKRKIHDVEEITELGNYYQQNSSTLRLPPGPKSVIMSRMQALNNSISNNYNSHHSHNNTNAKHKTESNGIQNNRNSSSSSTSSSTKHGTNFYFGQYIATALESLSSASAAEVRHKIQDLLFKAQLKQTVQKSGGGSGGDDHSSSRRRSLESPQHVVVYNESTGREQYLEIEKD